MTVDQLILHLQQLPPDIPLVIRGYEEGYNPISELIPRNLIPHPDQDKDYYGEFNDAKPERGGGFDAMELYGINEKALD